MWLPIGTDCVRESKVSTCCQYALMIMKSKINFIVIKQYDGKEFIHSHNCKQLSHCQCLKKKKKHRQWQHIFFAVRLYIASWLPQYPSQKIIVTTCLKCRPKTY